MSTINEKIEIRELSEEEIMSLVSNILSNKERYKEEAKYILELNLETRIAGCGYVYLYGQDIQKLLGEADILILERREDYDCTLREKIVVIPKSVPVVILEEEWDDYPEAKNKLTIHVFNGEDWRSMSITVPKWFRLSDILP
jgi:hypothetical protein